jgi:hypothetical protein
VFRHRYGYQSYLNFKFFLSPAVPSLGYLSGCITVSLLRSNSQHLSFFEGFYFKHKLLLKGRSTETPPVADTVRC